MLVINANNQQDTTNYMLAEPGYPDVDSILMRGGPKVVTYYNSATTVTWQGVNDSPVIDTIGTEPINFYCPKIYKSGLRQGIMNRDNNIYTSGIQVPIDFGKVYMAAGNNALYKVTWDTGYRIAVKWLQAGQVVWEKIIAPLLLLGMGSNAIYIKGTLTITFWLLHSDGTKTTIATITPSRVGGTAPYTSGYLLKGMNAQLAIQTALHLGTYDGTGQTAQDGDILYADVIINTRESYWLANSTYNDNVWPIGICYWSTNNNDMRDVYWFRPFQVSIRDA